MMQSVTSSATKKNWADLAYESESDDDLEAVQESPSLIKRYTDDSRPIQIKDIPPLKKSQSEIKSSRQYFFPYQTSNENNQGSLKAYNKNSKNKVGPYDPDRRLKEKIMKDIEFTDQQDIRIDIKDIPESYLRKDELKQYFDKYDIKDIIIDNRSRKATIVVSKMEAISLINNFGLQATFGNYTANIYYLAIEEPQRRKEKGHNHNNSYQQNSQAQYNVVEKSNSNFVQKAPQTVFLQRSSIVRPNEESGQTNDNHFKQQSKNQTVEHNSYRQNDSNQRDQNYSYKKKDQGYDDYRYQDDVTNKNYSHSKDQHQNEEQNQNQSSNGKHERDSQQNFKQKNVDQQKQNHDQPNRTIQKVYQAKNNKSNQQLLSKQLYVEKKPLQNHQLEQITSNASVKLLNEDPIDDFKLNEGEDNILLNEEICFQFIVLQDPGTNDSSERDDKLDSREAKDSDDKQVLKKKKKNKKKKNQLTPIQQFASANNIKGLAKQSNLFAFLSPQNGPKK